MHILGGLFFMDTFSTVKIKCIDNLFNKETRLVP